MAEPVAGLPPGCRQLVRPQVLTIRHGSGDTLAAAAIARLGLTWCSQPGRFAGTDPVLAWRGPQEILAIATTGEPLTQLLDSLAPGRHATAVAADLSEALVVLELNASTLAGWLNRLVDVSAVPAEPGGASVCRLVDVPVMLLRLAPDRAWLVVERPLLPYVSDWLAYTRQDA